MYTEWATEIKVTARCTWQRLSGKVMVRPLVNCAKDQANILSGFQFTPICTLHFLFSENISTE